MKHHGILFKAAMIRATLDGRKTQTRRLAGLEIINNIANAGVDGPDTWELVEKPEYEDFVFRDQTGELESAVPKYAVGDLLYAKETFCNVSLSCYPPVYLFLADDETQSVPVPWTPSIFMPKKLSRIWLEVTEVRCERVRSITEADALAEGVTIGEDRSYSHAELGIKYTPYKAAYETLWNTINTAPGATWEANPWVWVYTFKRTERPQL